MAAIDLEMTVPRSTIVDDIERAQRTKGRRGRTIFILVWVGLMAAIALLLLATNNVDGPWIATWAPFIIGGAGVTIFICVTSITLATALAVVGALARLSSNTVVYALASFYVSIVRGTPLLVQIFFIYFALPQLGIILPALLAGILALGFNYGAYMTEIFRAGIQAVPRGQREAAEALGLPEGTVMRRIVLPQAIRIVIPAIGNDFISMIKDSALVSAITVQEVLNRAETVGRPSLHTLQALVIAALVYWILTIAFSLVQERLEARMRRSDR
jgi:polar amino acid transport system permease protein